MSSFQLGIGNNGAANGGGTGGGSNNGEHIFKVIIIGEGTTGKTALIRRYVDGVFDKTYKSTLGVDFALKVLELSKTEIVRLQLWDIAGQERFQKMTRVYYKAAAAAIVVFDLTQKWSFQKVRDWKMDVDSKVRLPNNEPIPCLLLANKCDLPDRQVTKEEVDALAKELGFNAWFETSAKDNINIDKAIKLLLQSLLSAQNPLGANPNGMSSNRDNIVIGEGGASPENKSSGGCFCGGGGN